MKLTKNQWIMAGGSLILLLMTLTTLRNCALDNKLAYWKGQYEEQRRVVIENTRLMEKENGLLRAKVDELNGMIDSSNTIISDLDEQGADKDKKIGELDAKLLKAKTDAERVPVLSALIVEWKDKFSLAQGVIGEKDKIIFSLTEKYNTQLQISGNLEQALGAEQALRMGCEQRLSLLTKKVVRQRITGTMKNVAIGVVVGWVSWSLLKK